MVYVFSLNSHELIEMMDYEDPNLGHITALDCTYVEEKGSVFALGTSAGKIIV